MKIPFYQIDAFTSRVFGGNPAAVLELADWLPDKTLQAITCENNLSDTGFFVRHEGYYDLRWFTPTMEVDLCGHATLASAHVIFEEFGSDAEQIEFRTRSGPLYVRRDGERLAMDFPSKRARPVEAPEPLLRGLKIVPSEILATDDYLVVFESEEQVRSLEPDQQLLGQIDLRGVICSAPGDEVDFVSRFFGPHLGIAEDPVTGSAHTTLIPYWSSRLDRRQLHARQISSRGGELWCEDQGERVQIAGHAAVYLRGEVALDSSKQAQPTGG
ncbi:MAG: PhzF family phenazine biosynthesis protein [Candidatus Binatia bacterium]